MLLQNISSQIQHTYISNARTCILVYLTCSMRFRRIRKYQYPPARGRPTSAIGAIIHRREQRIRSHVSRGNLARSFPQRRPPQPKKFVVVVFGKLSQGKIGRQRLVSPRSGLAQAVGGLIAVKASSFPRANSTPTTQHSLYISAAAALYLRYENRKRVSSNDTRNIEA